MKKFTTIVSSIMFAGLFAQAGTLPAGEPYDYYGTPVEGSYVTSADYLWVEWDEDLTFVEGVTPYFTLQKNDDQPEKFENTVYESYQAKITLGSPYNYPLYESSKYLVFSLGYLYAPENNGKYTLSIPAGIVQNSAGDTNPEQSITFYVVSALTSYSENFTVNPIQSQGPDYNFYTAAELGTVTLGWENVTIEGTGNGEVSAYIDYYDQQNITDNVSFSQGKMVLNLSSLTTGSWTISIPQGFIKGSDDEGTNYTNSSFTLAYTIANGDTALGKGEITSPASPYGNYFYYADLSYGQPIKLVDDAPTVTLGNNDETINLTASIVVDYSNNYVLRVQNPSGYLEDAGKYTLTVPAGVVTNGNYQNEAFTCDFYVYTTDNNYVAVPADHTTVGTEELQRITVTFPDAETISRIEDNWTDFTLTTINYGVSREESQLKWEENISIEGNAIVIEIPNIQQLEYEIKIPAFDFIVGEGGTNPQIYLYYTAWDGMPEPIALQAPNAKSTQDVVVELTWDYQTITATDDFGVKLTYGYYEEPLEVSAGLYQLTHVDDPDGVATDPNLYNALHINLTPVLEEYLENNTSSTAVSFTLTVPAGIVVNGLDQVNPKSQFTFTVYPAIDVEPIFEETSTPGVYALYWEDVTWMSSFTGNLTLTGEGEEYTFQQDDDYYATVPAEGMFMSGYLDPDNYSGRAILINFNGLDFEGRYSLNVPEGFVAVNFNGSWTDYINPAMSLSIILNGDGTVGVGSISNDNLNGDIRVYNLNGINVLNSSNASDLNSLPNGIYVVNGKKVVIRH